MPYTNELKFDNDLFRSKLNKLEEFLSTIKYLVLTEYVITVIPTLWFILYCNHRNGESALVQTIFFGGILLFLPKFLFRQVVTTIYVMRKLKCRYDMATYFINNNSSPLTVPESFTFYYQMCAEFAATHHIQKEDQFFYVYENFADYQSEDPIDRLEERRKHLKAVLSIIDSKIIVGTTEIYRSNVPVLINHAANRRDPISQLVLLYALQSYKPVF